MLTSLQLILFSTLVVLISCSAVPSSHFHNRDASQYKEPFIYKGFDLSSLKILEDGGAVFKDSQDGNKTKPVEDMLDGMNTVRLRLWVHPKVPFDGGCKFSVEACGDSGLILQTTKRTT